MDTKWFKLVRGALAAASPDASEASSRDSVRSPSKNAANCDASLSGATQINDHVYVVHNPLPEKRPSVEIVFFHGLQLQESQDAHFTTWLSRDKTQLWLHWILEVKNLQDARILTVSYDAHARRTDKEGRMTMYATGENLLGCLVEGGAQVGQDGCPVILVGHCLGGLVMKELCLQAHERVTLYPLDTFNERVHNFLDNVRGLAFYATPHHGTRLADISMYRRGPLLKSLNVLDDEAALLNEKFRILRQKFKWKSVGLGESCPANLKNFSYKDLVVEEGSARHDVDFFYTVSDSDHFDICRPVSTKSSNFVCLVTLITDAMKEDKNLHGPKLWISEKARGRVVGLQQQVKRVRDKLEENRRLGIFGMGGIGKTTLAKTVCDAISKYFEYACFLLEVKKLISNDDNSESLQEKIKENLYFRGRLVRPNFEWNRLAGKKVLIALDDVTSGFQLEVMNQLASDFSNESRIIVTTRKSSFLRAEGFQDFPAEMLNDEDSRSLFCMHAFTSTQLLSSYEGVVEGILKKCGGFPLAIELSGRYLCEQPQELWNDALQKLSKALPINGENTDGLKLIFDSSYESLGNPEQQMFLDVAHCFHGERLSTVKRTWEMCGWEAHCGWKTLLNRALVTEVPLQDGLYVSLERDSRYAVQMHELLRDYGRNRELCPEPAKIEYTPIQGTFPVGFWKISFNDSHFNILQEMQNPENPLRHGVPRADRASHTLPGEFHLLKMEYLHRWISSRIDTAISQKVPPLRCLEIVNCSSLAFLPKSLGQLQGLQHLTIEKCRKLESIPESLGQLRALEHLELQGCDSLRTLPISLGQLCALQHLSIGECKSLRFLPDSLGQLHSLEHLMIKGCHGLRDLPNSLGKLGALKHLAIEECDGLFHLPRGGWHLGALEYLKIQECHRINRLGWGVTFLQALKHLTIANCSRLESLPEILGKFRSLEHLTIQGCDVLEALPESVGELPFLKHLTVRCCKSLIALPWTLGFLQVLEQLTIEECQSLEVLPFGWPPTLKRLTIRRCPRLRHVQFSLKAFPDLKDPIIEPENLLHLLSR